MERITKFISVMGLAATAVLASCGNKQASGTGTAPAADTVVRETSATDTAPLQAAPAAEDTMPSAAAEPVKEDTSASDIALIKSLYSKCVFGGPNAGYLKKVCTAKVLSRLAAANEYDDGGYAAWEFRSGAQDGDGPSKVNSVTPEGDGWYKVSMLDMGIKCTKRLRVTDGKISDYR